MLDDDEYGFCESFQGIEQDSQFGQCFAGGCNVLLAQRYGPVLTGQLVIHENGEFAQQSQSQDFSGRTGAGANGGDDD